MKRWLIVNADDFGLSAGVNRGIIDAHEHGIVTSASLMVRQPAAAAAAHYAKAHPELSVGLHVDLGEWESDSSGKWKTIYQFADLDDPRAVKEEFVSQLRIFREMLGKNPSHLDSHQHVHQNNVPVTRMLQQAGRAMRVPVRHFHSVIRYCGDFYGSDRVDAQSLVRVIEILPPGVTELCCHPGDDPDLASSYRLERRDEMTALTHPDVKKAV